MEYHDEVSIGRDERSIAEIVGGWRAVFLWRCKWLAFLGLLVAIAGQIEEG